MAPVQVDGKNSHTHQPGAILTRWTWSVAGIGIVGEGETPQLMLPIGTWQVYLEVEDSGGDIESDFALATVEAYGYPELSTVTPDVGDVSGGDTLTIIGNFLSSVEKVRIGSTLLEGNAVNVLNENEVQITSPSAGQPDTVQISVVTPLGESNSVPFQYIDATLPPVQWESGVVQGIDGPTSLSFGPDGRLYIGTQMGEVVRWTLDDDYNVIESETLVSSAIQDSEEAFRVILGIALDPDDTSPNPCVYVSHASVSKF